MLDIGALNKLEVAPAAARRDLTHADLSAVVALDLCPLLDLGVLAQHGGKAGQA